MNINLSSPTNALMAAPWERKATVAGQEADAHGTEISQMSQKGDQVRLGTMPTLLEDHEVQGVLDETMTMISNDTYAALHAHSGLDASRVAALLA